MWLHAMSLAIVAMPATGTVMTHASSSPASPHLDRVALFGFLSAFVTIACLPHWRSSRAMKLVFAACLLADAAYAFLAGAWPVGLVAIVAAGMAVHASWKDRFLQHAPARRRLERQRATPHDSRTLHLFGSSCDDRDAAENN
jgi:hypothetical protein